MRGVLFDMIASFYVPNKEGKIAQMEKLSLFQSNERVGYTT
jgi:hypothetical protein